MFLIPPVACIVLFVLSAWASLLSRPGMVGGLVVIGVTAQFVAPVYSAAWVTALLVNVGVAVYLTIRLKLDW